MTVSSTVNRINYTAGGGTTFAYTFRIFDKTNLLVYIDGTLKTVDVDYSVTGVGVEGGGNVVFTVAPTVGASIVILRELPLTQLTDYPEGDPFPAKSHEDALDRLIMIAQKFGESVQRILSLPVTSLLTNIEVPIEAGKPFRWNSGADGLEIFTINPSDVLNVLTTRGDIIRAGASGIAERLGLGATKKVLKSDGTDVVWGDEADIVLTTRGDILFRNATGLARLAAGTSGQILKTQGASADPVWVNRAVRKILFPASCFESRVAAGWAAFVQTQGTNLDFGEFDFDAASDEKIISPAFRLTNWAGGTVTVRLGWKANATTGNVMWVVSFLGRDTTTPEAFDAALTDHAQTAETTAGTAEYLKESVFTITASELSNNDAVIMKIARNADDAGDTLAVDAKLLYVEIEYNEA